MKYDFTSILDRQGRDALAIDSVGHGHAPGAPREGFDVIPMWIADMNFPTIPTVPAAIIERAKHPVYGYFFPSDAYFNAIFRWQEQRHGVTGLTRENIGYENGVLGGVVSALNVFCSKGGNVLLHSPTYTGFTGALGNNGYNMILSPLVKDENGVWRMDFEDMEKKIMEKTLKIEGMMCGHCEATVKKTLEAIEGVASADVSHESGTAVVTLSAPVEDAALKKAVEDKDYKVTGIE